MSVIVKGMELPKSCPCELVGVGYDTLCTFAYGIPSRVREYYECCEKGTRPDWCPLIEVSTPHRRLIEEPQFFDIQGLVFIADTDFVGTAKYFMDQLRAQPTIIGAEDE